MQDSNSRSGSSASHRDAYTAALILLVIALTVFFGYRGAPPGSIPTPPQPVKHAVRPNGEYDLDTAITLAGEQLPRDADAYYFFAFVDAVAPEQEIAELSEKLKQASDEHEFLGIAGPDAERNRRNLLAALDASKGHELGGVVIIYVGPAADREEVSSAVKASGAAIRFVAYPKEKPAI